LSNESVQVLIVGSLDAEIAATDIIDGLIVDHETAIGMLEGRVSGENRIVWLDHGSCDLRSRVDAELQLALLAIVDRQTLHEQSTEPRTSATTERVEDKEALETGTVVCYPTDLVKDLVNQLFANSVVASSIVVGCIFLACDHMLRVE
jgi:hypothetical protein